MSKKNKKNGYTGSGSRNMLIVLVVLIAGIFLLTRLTDYTRSVQEFSYSDFLKKVEKDEVRMVHVSGSQVYGRLKDGTQFESVIAEVPANWDLLRAHDVDFSVGDPSAGINWWHFMPLAFVVAIGLAALWFFIRQSRGSGSGSNWMFTMGKSKARMFMPSAIKETFESVAGVPEAKEELQDVVDFLKNPEKYKKLGARITRGVLLVGEPGNGKTLLAKAVAGEANCPFFSISGSDFVEVFVGVGAARVRDLFAEARKHAPCIIFIDEIDAVGRQRSLGAGGGHDEREQTLNQLLSEMDGFNTQTGGAVIVLAATNRADILDKALLRPGRFDRQVEVPYPDQLSRLQILKVHAKEVQLSADVNLEKVARGTSGFSGADLANLINEAAIIASKKGNEEVSMVDLDEARDKKLVGKELKHKIMNEEEREMTAYHEAGHALINLLLPDCTDPLHKATIVPRGHSLGVTYRLPERDTYIGTEKRMRGDITVLMGGRAAEELIYNMRATGAHSDFKNATHIARRMVYYYGMSAQLGPVVFDDLNLISSKTAQNIDEEVRRILVECQDHAMQLLKDNKEKLEKLAQALLEKETLQADEIYELLDIAPRATHTF